MVTSNAESASSIPGWGNKVPCATWLKTNKQKTQDLQNSQFQATPMMCSCPVPPRFPNIVILIQSESLGVFYTRDWVSQVALVVKDLPANARDARNVGFITGEKDPLEEGMTTHFSILPWRIPQTEEPGRLQSIGSKRAGRE